MTQPPLLDIEELAVTFATTDGAVPAVAGVSLTVCKGECLAIVGESGSGKSQTFLAALGLSPKGAAVSGRVRLNGENMIGRSQRWLNGVRGNTVSMSFQNPMTSLTPHLTIESQLVETLRAHGERDRGTARHKARLALEQVYLPDTEHILKQYPFELSGGMVQRVMIAMAILGEPELIIADEPTTALDVTVQAEILRLLRERQQERGAALIFVTHDMAVVTQIADRVGVMYAGRLVETGLTRDILEAPRHPYTIGLINAAPRLSGPVLDTLPAIPGQPPNGAEWGSACAFAPRCTHVFDRCRLERPQLRNTGLRIACHLDGKAATR